MTRALPRPSEQTLRRCKQCRLKKPATREYFKAEKRNKTGCAARCRLCMNLNRFWQRQRKRIEAEWLDKTPPWLMGTPEYIEYRRKKTRLYSRIRDAKEQGEEKRVQRLQTWLATLKTEWLTYINEQPRPILQDY